MSYQHNIYYFCQFPGHQNISFASAEGLETHLTDCHSRSIPPGHVSLLTEKGKHQGPDVLVPLVIDWNKEQPERTNFIACPLCSVRILDLPGLSTEARLEIIPAEESMGTSKFDLDSLQNNSSELPELTRGHILDHLAQHLEAIALLSLPDLRHLENQSKSPRIDTSADTIPVTPVSAIDQSPSEWKWSIEHNRYYRWRYDSKRQKLYQWQKGVSNTTPANTSPAYPSRAYYFPLYNYNMGQEIIPPEPSKSNSSLSYC